MGLGRQLVRRIMTTCLPPSRWLVRGSRRATESPAISLTFDDGPHPEHTPRVLDALARWNAVGTFFVIGQAAATYPDLIARMLAEGHTLGNHTWTHQEPSATPTREFLAEVAQTDSWLSYQTGFRPRWMRPPKGELTWGKLRGLWQSGHTVSLWNVDPRDYRMTSTADVARWASAYRPQTGDILLLHDRLPWAAQIVDALGSRGCLDAFRSVSLDVWLSAEKKTSARPIPPVSLNRNVAAASR
ncbi:MAG: polysaccharide deacetylase family protein [Planctomycetaceae bacterium]|nr:polysaccharide deacetylase family protein [Planctomycetaceae bacterium]